MEKGDQGSQIKKTVLELGGSDPFVVFPDANLEKAVDMGIASRYLNCGQSCIGAKRFLIHEEIYDQFVQLFKLKLSELVVGDPEKIETDVYASLEWCSAGRRGRKGTRTRAALAPDRPKLS